MSCDVGHLFWFERPQKWFRETVTRVFMCHPFFNWSVFESGQIRVFNRFLNQLGIRDFIISFKTNYNSMKIGFITYVKEIRIKIIDIIELID